MLATAAGLTGVGVGARSACQTLHDYSGRQWAPAPGRQFGLVRYSPPGLGAHFISLIIGPQYRCQNRGVAYANHMRRAKGSHDLAGQPCQVQIAAKPAFAHLQAVSHPLLTAAIVSLNRTGVVAGALIIREVATAPVFEVGDPERFFVGKFAGLDQELEFGLMMGPHPTYRPMAPSAADNLETVVGIPLDPPHNGWEILSSLRLEALDQVGAGFFVECRVIAIVSLPDPAPRWIDQFLDASDGIPGGKFRKSVLTAGEQAGSRRQATASDWRGRRACKTLSEAAVSDRHALFLP